MEGFKVVIVGGGSSHTPGIIQSLIANLDRFPLKKLVLYDIDPDRLELVDTLCGSLIAKLDPECVYFTTTDPEKAYTDIDFAFAQIRQGAWKCGRRTRRSRWSLALWVRRPAARRHGIRPAFHPRRVPGDRRCAQVRTRGMDYQLLQPCCDRG